MARPLICFGRYGADQWLGSGLVPVPTLSSNLLFRRNWEAHSHVVSGALDLNLDVGLVSSDSEPAIKAAVEHCGTTGTRCCKRYRLEQGRLSRAVPAG